MTEIRRYTHQLYNEYDSEMFPCKNGEWVKWEDHIKALAERDEAHQCELDNLADPDMTP